MAQKRTDKILEILKQQGYVTVKNLCEELHYSTATINRDLNDLQRQKLIVRHYGGAELVAKKGVPLVFRYNKMRPVKRAISKRATAYMKEGMTVFIDGSTTAQYMAEYIQNIKDITVITNNLNLVTHLSEAGVHCISLGGTIVEPPYMVGGEDAAAQASTYTADMAFFSVGGISAEGLIYDGGGYYVLHKAMLARSRKSVLLVDHEKIGIESKRVLCDFAKVSTVISDFAFSDAVHQNFPETEFVQIPSPVQNG